MNSKVKQLEIKLDRLNIAYDRLSEDKTDARKALKNDIQNVKKEIVQASKTPPPKDKSTNILTMLIIGILLAVVIGFVSYFATGGKL